MGAGTTNYSDNQRGMGEAPALELDIFRLCVRVFGAERCCNCATGSEPRIIFKHDKTPRRKLTVVRHSASNAQKFVDFGSGGPGGFQLDRFEGTSGGKEFNGIGHDLIPTKAS